ncbi:MAG: MBL fold metallo-hydrolase [Deltaproteobacteria bacterium]|jgi:glyoxylase-like metal-dependent hydrolase (beta-lactamase superfamily II)|nr:MBL fold metallo-hydrolase [Deltaproteobacteria bacterium]
MKITSSIYFYPFSGGLENNCNTIVLTGDVPIIVDPGHKHLWPSLKAKIMDDGLNPADFKMALFTHCHPDHMEAGQILEEEYGTVQAMSAVEKEFYDGPGQGFFPWMGLDPPTGDIGRLLDPGVLDLGDKVLELYLTPGHSPGGLCLHWPKEGLLVTGDIIFSHSFGRTDFPGGSLVELKKSVNRLKALDKVEMALPGHGPAIMGAKAIADNFAYVLDIMDRY